MMKHLVLALTIAVITPGPATAEEDCPGTIINILWWENVCWWSGPPIRHEDRRLPTQAPIRLEVTPRPTPPDIIKACPVVVNGNCTGG